MIDNPTTMETQNQPRMVSEATKRTLPQWPPNPPIQPPPPPPPPVPPAIAPPKLKPMVVPAGYESLHDLHRPLGLTRSCPPRQWPPSSPSMSQQQAEARHMVLNEIKELQLRRQSSFKRILRLPMWGSGNCMIFTQSVRLPTEPLKARCQSLLCT